MNIVMKKLAELQKPEKNIRIHTKKQISEYKRSIQKYGITRPIVCNKDGIVLIGNGLYEAAQELGLAEVPCIVREDLDEKEQLKLMLADNKVFELGLTDTQAFEDILKDIGADFDIPGYDASMLEMLNMSFSDVDDYVVSYGTFEDEDVERISEKTAETHTEGVATGAPAYQPISPISNIPMEEKPAQGLSYTKNAEQSRYFICPKCGERIPLPEGM